MQIFHSLSTWQAFRQTLPVESMGFVPTMGNLHQGHATLYTTSKQENQLTVASIFVNPTQFNERQDYTCYPRTLEQDLALLADLKVDYCLIPEEHAIYADAYRFQVHAKSASSLMEDRHRPGHFNGVLTIVLKLLHLIQPHRAYFGEKDYQQFQLIQDMVQALFLPIEIKSCPTIRESSGLPFSSRNSRLNPTEKSLAEKFAAIFHQKKENLAHIATQLQNLGIQVEYLEEHQDRRFIAVRIGEVRLIDNYLISS